MNRAYAGAVAIITGLGCATAIVDPDPGTVGPVDEGSGGVGGASSVGGAGGTGGTAATGGSDATGGSSASGGDTSSGAAGGTAEGGRGGRSGTGMGGTQNPGAGRSGTGTSGASAMAFGGRNAMGTGGGNAGTGAAGRVGRGTAGMSGMSGMSGMTMGGAGASSSVACPMPRTPANPGATQGDSGSFETTDAVCYFVEGTFNAWNCSNLGGRTVTVNGKVTMCGGALPAPVDGGYYFEFGASSAGTEYTSFYWYSS